MLSTTPTTIPLRIKTNEISRKDQKYQNKIKLLDTEHTALQAQYDSIKSAIGENVKRSFTSFSG